MKSGITTLKQTCGQYSFSSSDGFNQIVTCIQGVTDCVDAEISLGHSVLPQQIVESDGHQQMREDQGQTLDRCDAE